MEEQIELPAGSEPLENARWEHLAQAYLISNVVNKASKEAGYSDRISGWRAYKQPLVQARIKFLQEERAKELGIDAYYVLNNLKTIAERCMQAEEVKDREGNSTGEYKFDSSSAIKANELIGKHLGLFSEKVKHEHTGAEGGPIQHVNTPLSLTELENLTTEQLSRLAINGKL
ncbi:MAG: hypothetical protein GAK29_01679 [Acinetobacter bereziniae]|uniref:Terminase small subunit n=1 Tax=Acinetobacter bereziniae TaxID=106648 RepID=A0A833PGA2_ACIBZ|nr:MAG: hypothetical protein GAK29_01679 [Acinetobacter bereziniae]